MRGPKIAAGVRSDWSLVIIAINGRIRESVGATHKDLAKNMIENEVIEGLGFDPGGSVTLVVNGHQLNVTPYNDKIHENPYVLPPKARPVGNAVVGYI